MDGQNLSFQVHPLTQYIREQFGMPYTQDESYYILDAASGSQVYLGLTDQAEKTAMRAALEKAQAGGDPFDAEHFVATWPVAKHDHVLIPAGTPHCSGKNCVVLEISATPYIFTFKLWDWGRLDLDGTPRPINMEHGFRNIQWERRLEWVRANLINQVKIIAEGEGWREEKTGLHALEFIETRRHWFTKPVRHNTGGQDVGSVNVLCLVEGDRIVVESPVDAFAPFTVNYAETFVVPAAVGEYIIRPYRPSVGQRCATVKARVRR
jgi:mannose-6-phosphate isomerase class I